MLKMYYFRRQTDKQRMQIQFLGQEDSLKKEMATHSSILTWQATVNGGNKELDTTGVT